MIAFPQEPPDESDEPTPNDPSPDEIRQRAIEIQQRWSESQRKRRRVQKDQSAWLPPFIIGSQLSADPPSEQN